MKSLWLKVWYALLVAGSWLSIHTGIYYWWSRVCWRLFERKTYRLIIRPFADERELQAFMAPWKWTKDPWWVLGDAFSAPGTVEVRGTKGEPVGDCDDFSIYAATALQHIEASTGQINGKIAREVSILTIPWMEPNGKGSGHNVCVFQYLHPDGQVAWAWVSNWYASHIQWNAPGGIALKSIQEVVARVVAPANAKPLCWARVTPDLKHIIQRGRG